MADLGYATLNGQIIAKWLAKDLATDEWGFSADQDTSDGDFASPWKINGSPSKMMVGVGSFGSWK